MTRSHRSTTQANSSLAIFSAILLGILVLATPALAVISQSATTTTLVASPSSVTAGSVVTLTATVASGGTPLTAGQVVFCNASAPSCEDSAILGTAWVTISGTATIRRALPSGTTNITASYRATKLYLSSQSSQAAVTVTGQQQVASTANTFPSLGNSAAGVVAADFNNDGFQDLAVTDNNGTVQIFFGGGNGTFTPGPSISLYAGGGSGVPVSIATGDFNRDGIADLVVQGRYILLGKGDGTFTLGATPPRAIGAFAQVADFNSDGIADIVLYSGDSDFTVLFGLGDGTFRLGPSTGSSGGGQSFALADFNGDGLTDIVVSGGYGVGVEVLMGNGDGTFARTPVYLNSGVNPQNVTVGDFNGDGNPDIAVADLTNQTVTILTGPGADTIAHYVDGTSRFTVGTPRAAGLPAGSQATLRQIVAADYNGDGFTDLVLAVGWNATGDPSLVLLPGNGNGSFGTASTFTATPASTYFQGGLAVADFYGSGQAALALITGVSPSYLTVLQDTSSGVTPVKQLPIVTWTTPAAITNPTPLSATQLNATANVPGTFTYVPATGAVLAAGTQTLMVTFTPTDTTTYSTAEGTVTLTVAPAPAQSYTFTASTTTLTGSGTVTLNLHSINYTGTVSFNAVVTSSNGTASNVTASAPSVALAYDASGSTVLTVTASSSAANHVPALPWQSGGAIVFGAVLLGVPLTVRRKRVLAVLLVAATIMLAGFCVACSNAPTVKSAPRIYTVTVTPTGTGTVTDATPLTITVTVK
jgi:hypothetical protein